MFQEKSVYSILILVDTTATFCATLLSLVEASPFDLHLDGNLTQEDIQMNVFMYSHPLLLVEPISICQVEEVVNEQVSQEFSPD